MRTVSVKYGYNSPCECQHIHHMMWIRGFKEQFWPDSAMITILQQKWRRSYPLDTYVSPQSYSFSTQTDIIEHFIKRSNLDFRKYVRGGFCHSSGLSAWKPWTESTALTL